PFTPTELQAFAREPEVVLGNHTAHHAVLTNYTPPAAAQELAECQHYLTQLTGAEPVAVAYPNGNCSLAVVAAAAQAGLQLGATVQAGKNYLPLASAPAGALQLKRFLLWGNQDVQAQCKLFPAHCLGEGLSETPLSPLRPVAPARFGAASTRHDGRLAGAGAAAQPRLHYSPQLGGNSPGVFSAAGSVRSQSLAGGFPRWHAGHERFSGGASSSRLAAAAARRDAHHCGPSQPRAGAGRGASSRATPPGSGRH
nr:hypothetical protein [Tanacetum cinerariifolium]